MNSPLRVGLRRDIPRQHLMRLLVKASHTVRVKLEAANPAGADMIEKAVVEAADSILEPYRCNIARVRRGSCAYRRAACRLLSRRERSRGLRKGQSIRGDDGRAGGSLQSTDRSGRSGDGSVSGGGHPAHGQGRRNVMADGASHPADARGSARYIAGGNPTEPRDILAPETGARPPNHRFSGQKFTNLAIRPAYRLNGARVKSAGTDPTLTAR